MWTNPGSSASLVAENVTGVWRCDPAPGHQRGGMAACLRLDWLGLGLILTMVAPSLCQGCPQRCECVPQLRSVACPHKSLTSIPEGIPNETRLLDLSQNRLRWIEHGDLDPYSQLEEVDLSDNIISVLEPNAFSSLRDLRVLQLRGNQLKLVPMGAFSRLANLTTLDLSENKIVILLDFTFQDLCSLRHLEVGDNDLVYISNKAFIGLLGLQELTIERCNLTSISGQSLSYLRNLVTLRLRHLSIPTLEDQNFRKLASLRGLEIDHWSFLEYISPLSFQGLNLSWLSITYTNITSVPSASFRNLAHLTSLNLSYNSISMLGPWAFRDLVRLKELHLVSTNLVSVELNALSGLRQLRMLNLSGNELLTLEEGAFHSVNSLETLRVDKNPLACDCRLLWILQRRKTINFDGQAPVCASPAEVQGKAFSAFSDSALFDRFTCQKPKIRNRKMQQVTTREGQPVSFLCRAEGDPAPAIFWISPQRRRITSRSSGRITVLPGGTLEIRYAQLTDSGTYICIASNAGGNDTYFATLTVKGLPLDAVAMANRSYYAGDLNDTNQNDTRVFLKFTLDLKTILVSTAMGCITFLGVVLFCFLLLFVWSRGRGQHKNHFSVEYSFRKADGPSAGGGQGGARKFNMKMI
ncbi:leucine-rich repeat and immunoglobulin-like domain-containing nogo receptor-interacting protein 3a isoform X2 [Paramormyrops kingsleyae]|uniref:Leucine rich repeat and Ig domain containing 3a n=1 Tax=Paramormyrops kingsleyae TaxID=1676925 RepID=A0A3B3TFQ7_9TELE|nr:leucine-rich repeat and immunoglobulin-like domain-containing nogo receptor-interacting protein 3 isoform X2 [Paramormyrops kingsleyae]XP_023699776.1 leucine-rich repeat and immunoglobulin-like domain-containing nogo receptor-interacting protein 3 isoform X2 [Paramormyrops kingsleyae]XP_023699777.1 leucine-rich repeat and immunoglobulin-like domain-containing nogo receptor-interacting protein 3 isoform X2 [Paramormyrops kingsleyae]XP_023699778.1 leucine-rich repeat and immunoglobulin-like dom